MSDHSHAVCEEGKHQSYVVGSGGRCHRTNLGVVQSSDLRPLSGLELHLVNLLIELTLE